MAVEPKHRREDTDTRNHTQQMQGFVRIAAVIDPDERARMDRPLREIVEEDTLASTIATRSAERLATERLFQIDERREIAELLRRGWSQRKIANALSTTQPRIHRLQKVLER